MHSCSTHELGSPNYVYNYFKINYVQIQHFNDSHFVINSVTLNHQLLDELQFYLLVLQYLLFGLNVTEV